MKIGLVYLEATLDNERRKLVNSVNDYLSSFDNLETQVISLPSDKVGQFDYAISFGGDGTFMSMAYDFKDNADAFSALAFSERSKGVYCGVDLNNWNVDLERLINGKCTTIDTMRLGIRNEKDSDYLSLAINDFTLTPVLQGAMFEYKLELGNSKFTEGRSTSMIISTPMGSTAYSLSAGGSVIDRDADVYSITPESPSKPQNANQRVRSEAKDMQNLTSPQIRAGNSQTTIIPKKPTVIITDGPHRNLYVDGSRRLVIEKVDPLKLIQF